MGHNMNEGLLSHEASRVEEVKLQLDSFLEELDGFAQSVKGITQTNPEIFDQSAVENWDSKCHQAFSAFVPYRLSRLQEAVSLLQTRLASTPADNPTRVLALISESRTAIEKALTIQAKPEEVSNG